jgi:hypothetical protein
MAILVAVLSTNNTTLRSCAIPNHPQAIQKMKLPRTAYVGVSQVETALSFAHAEHAKST